MKTYRQKMQDWVKYKISNCQEPVQKSTYEEVLDKLKELEGDERTMVNNIYHDGYNDCESGLPHKSDIYESKFKLHDLLKKAIGK